MVGEDLEEVLAEKGLPAVTVGRIAEPSKYTSMMKQDRVVGQL